MNNPIVFMFSGQGSQYYHMGKQLFEQEPFFAQTMTNLDRIAQSTLGFSIVDELYGAHNKKSDLFDQVLFTHPGIFIMEYALAQLLIKQGIKPDMVLGTSLGEFVSVAVSGILPAEEALQLVIKQAQALEKNCRKGGMIAIMESPQIVNQYPEVFAGTEMAGQNFDKHFVLAGEYQKIQQIAPFLKEKSILHQVIPVTQGFHSSLLDAGAEEFKPAIASLQTKAPTVPVISCLYGTQTDGTTPNYLWDIVRKPILFQDTIRSLIGRGDFHFIDVGPGGTLSTFTKYNLPPQSGSQCHPTVTPFGMDLKNIDTLRSKLGL